MAQNNNKFTTPNIGLNSVTTNKMPIAEADLNFNTVQFVLAMLSVYIYLGGVNPLTGLGLLAGGDFKNRGLKGENLALTQATQSQTNQATPINITQTAGAFTNIGGTLTFKIDNPNKLATVISFIPQITDNTFTNSFAAANIRGLQLAIYLKSSLPTAANPTPTRTFVKNINYKFTGNRLAIVTKDLELLKQTIRLNSQNLTSLYIDVDVLLTGYTINNSYTMTVAIPKDQVQIEYYNEII